MDRQIERKKERERGGGDSADPAKSADFDRGFRVRTIPG